MKKVHRQVALFLVATIAFFSVSCLNWQGAGYEADFGFDSIEYVDEISDYPFQLAESDIYVFKTKYKRKIKVKFRPMYCHFFPPAIAEEKDRVFQEGRLKLIFPDFIICSEFEFFYTLRGPPSVLV